MIEDIEKKSFKYTLVQKLWVKPTFRAVHREIKVVGLDNIPKNKPVIYAPNHQNALMDALALVQTTPLQTVFLARADIFKNKIIASILYFLKILPVYRIRDGKESLEKNTLIFAKAVEILKQNKHLCLFPEAAHTNSRSMLPHKKAIPRIAFLAGAQSETDLDIQIVPTGITYSNYYAFRRRIMINYGKPIALKPYLEIIKERGERDATIALRDKIFSEMEKLVVHIPVKEDVDIYERSFSFYRYSIIERLGIKKGIEGHLKADLFLLEKLKSNFNNDPDSKSWLDERLTALDNWYTKNNIKSKALRNDSCISKNLFVLLLLTIVMSPLLLFGSVINGWLFWLSTYSFRKSIKDKQFWSSVAFGITLIVFPLWYIVLFVVCGLLTANWWIALAATLAAPLCGIFTWDLSQVWITKHNQMKLGMIMSKESTEAAELSAISNNLNSFFDRITK